MSNDGSVVVIGGTGGLGREVARHYADEGRSVVISSRDQARAEAVAKEIGGDVRAVSVDLARPDGIAAGLADVGPVAHLVITPVSPGQITVHDYDTAAAIQLATLKLVGYTEVVHALVDRLGPDSSVVLFGGLAKERPYPGSTMITTVNGGITSLIRSLAIQLAPTRVNAIHPAIIGDSPRWENAPDEVLEGFRERTPIGRLVRVDEVVHAVAFLLENTAMNAVNLRVDGGWMVT